MNSKLAAATIAAAMTLTGILPASAQSTEAPAAKAPKARNMDEVVCEKTEVIGSRLATKKVCMTRAQWAERRRADQQEIERAQTMRGTKGE